MNSNNVADTPAYGPDFINVSSSSSSVTDHVSDSVLNEPIVKYRHPNATRR